MPESKKKKPATKTPTKSEDQYSAYESYANHLLMDLGNGPNVEQRYLIRSLVKKQMLDDGIKKISGGALNKLVGFPEDKPMPRWVMDDVAEV